MTQILPGATGIFGAGQMIYWIGETAKGEPPDENGELGRLLAGMER